MYLIYLLVAGIVWWYLVQLYQIVKFELIDNRMVTLEKQKEIDEQVADIVALWPGFIKFLPTLTPSLAWILRRNLNGQTSSSSTK